MEGDLNFSRILTIYLPLFFLAAVGLVDILQKFGYLKTENQKDLENKIKGMHETLRGFDKLKEGMVAGFEEMKGQLSDGLAGLEVRFTTIISSITSLTGILSEIKPNVDRTSDMVANPDFGLISIKAYSRLLTEELNDIKRNVEIVLQTITAKEAAGRVEKILEIVERHDRAVHRLDDIHPAADYHKGERPAHWCSASTLDVQLATLAEKMDHVYDSMRIGEKEDLSNMLKVVQLLTSVLETLDNVKKESAAIKKMFEGD